MNETAAVNNKTLAPKGSSPDIIIITGMSGAGRTEAMHTFEDLGYFCIDNLPPELLVSLVELTDPTSGHARKLAIVCDMRSREYFAQLETELDKLTAMEINYYVLFLDSSDSVLLNRYRSLRRRHPLATNDETLSEAISKERTLLEDVRISADLVIDTTSMPLRILKRRIRREFSGLSEVQQMSVSVFSFGFKYGAPIDADLVIDVRFLPNPYYDTEMRALTGFDKDVYEFVIQKPETEAFLKAWCNLLDTVMPGYVKEGKMHLGIGIGCTGGQHRSVVLAEATASYLTKCGYSVHSSHRDLPRVLDHYNG